MHSICTFALAAIALAASAASAGDEPSKPAAAELLNDIATQGARRVVRNLGNQPAVLDAVCAQIATADPAWLRVAKQLRAESDASVSLSLDYAVARALPRHPEAVLALVGHGFALDHICTSPFIEPEPGIAEAYERQAVAALRRLRPTTAVPESTIEECLRLVKGSGGPDTLRGGLTLSGLERPSETELRPRAGSRNASASPKRC